MYQKRYITCRQNASFPGGTICSISKWLIGERRELGWTVMPRYSKPKYGEADRTKAHMPTAGFRPPCRHFSTNRLFLMSELAIYQRLRFKRVDCDLITNGLVVSENPVSRELRSADAGLLPSCLVFPSEHDQLSIKFSMSDSACSRQLRMTS
jgi:hypothetical protein